MRPASVYPATVASSCCIAIGAPNMPSCCIASCIAIHTRYRRYAHVHRHTYRSSLTASTPCRVLYATGSSSVRVRRSAVVAGTDRVALRRRQGHRRRVGGWRSWLVTCRLCSCGGSERTKHEPENDTYARTTETDMDIWCLSVCLCVLCLEVESQNTKKCDVCEKKVRLRLSHSL